MSTRVAFERVGALPLSVVGEVGFIVFTIYLLSGGTLGLSPRPLAAGIDEGDPRLQGVLVLLYLTAFVLTLKRPRAWWRATGSDLGLVALLVWTGASVMWSDAPDVTLRRSLALFGTYFVGVYLAARFRLESQLRLVGAGMGLVIIYNAFLALSQPGVIADGAFAGGYSHRNSLGKTMALATLVFLCLAWNRRLRYGALAVAAMSFMLVVISGSATGLVVVLTMASLLPLLRLLQEDARAVAIFGIMAMLSLGIGVLMAPQAVEVIAPALGRDATLTGRTELWPLVVQMILERPWLGYGYQAFWLWDDRLVGLRWEPTHSHNGYLEVALTLGVVGLVLFVFVCARGVARAVLLIRQQGTPESFWPLSYFLFVLLYNVTEATALNRNSIIWVLFVSAVITVSPKLRTLGRSLSRSEPG